MARVEPRGGLPILGVDLDGVICGPLLGLNFGIDRGFLDPEAPPPRAKIPPRRLSRLVDHARFDLRRPLRGAREALVELRALRTVVLLTGRRNSPAHWLRWHGLADLVDEVIVNSTPLPSPHFKLDAISFLGVAEHIDDDGRTAQLLAQRSEARSFLRDWPRNRGLTFDAAVTRVADLGALVTLLREESAGGSPA